jgi:iron(III) transport system permease protein
LRRPDEPSPFRTVFAQVRPEFVNSLELGLCGAAVVMLIAWPAAYGLARSPSPRFEALLTSGAALPPVLLGLGVVAGWRFFADVPLLGTVYSSGLGLVLAAYAARFLPVAVRALRPLFDAECLAQDDAARLAGAGFGRRAWSVLGPLQAGAAAGVAALCYVLCFTELDATLMTYPPDLRTVQVRIFNMVHYSRDEEVAALCLLSVGAALVPPLFVALLRRDGRRSA